VLTKRACPVCGTSYPELDPRMFSYNSKHGWCTTCVGTGVTLTREQRAAYDDTVFAGDERGREQTLPSDEQEPEGVGNEPCPDCGGTRLNPSARAVTFDALDRRRRAMDGVRHAPLDRCARIDRPRRADRARHRQRDRQPSRVPRGSRARLS
jgi:excinuclease UvrABC ATPase subunit